MYAPVAMMPVLHEWETFYVIVGSAAAALTGLQFVVIALTAEREMAGGTEAVDAFATPTVVHFCAVLTIAAIDCVPGQSAISLGACIAILGLAGLAYGVATAFRARRQTGYAPVLSDWLWHAGFPIAAYTALLVTGIVTHNHAAGALYFIAAIALSLLFIGIHNAWDAAVYISMQNRGGGTK
jgi:hypothetical protein